MRLGRTTERVLQILANEKNQYQQKDVTRFLKVAKSVSWYHVHRLIDKGFITQEHKGKISTYRLTLKGKQYSSNFLTMGDDRGIRCHNITFKSYILNYPLNLIFTNEWRSVRVQNWVKHLKGFENVTVEFTPKSVIFYVNEYWAADSNQGAFIGFKIVERAITEILNEFPGLQLGQPKCLTKTIKQHYARPGDSFALKCRKAGISIKGRRHTVDFSKVPEVEFEHPRLSQNDCMRYSEFIDGFVEGRFDFEALAELGTTLHGLKDFVSGGTSLMNMMYAFQRRLEGDLTRAKKVRHYIKDKGQRGLNEYKEVRKDEK